MGYLVGDAAFIDAVDAIKGSVSGPCPCFSQQTALAALRLDPDPRVAFLDVYERRRAVLTDGLADLGIPHGHLGGGLFLWADVSEFGVGAERFCHDLLQATGVLIFPGNSFGDEWTHWVRISLLAPEDRIAAAIDRMRPYLDTVRAA